MRWPACGIVIEMTDVHVALKVDRTNHVVYVLSCVIRRTGPAAPCVEHRHIFTVKGKSVEESVVMSDQLGLARRGSGPRGRTPHAHAHGGPARA